MNFNELGQFIKISKLCKEAGVNYHTLTYRLRCGNKIPLSDSIRLKKALLGFTYTMQKNTENLQEEERVFSELSKIKFANQK